jgi:hypothetical protein
MNRLLKIFFIFNFIGLASLISDSCGKCDNSNLKYAWESIDLKTLKIVSIIDDRVSYRQVDTLIYQYDKFGIQILMNGKTLALVNKNNIGIQTCNAQLFDCFKDYTTDNKISDLKIRSLSEFDDTHPANSDISKYFRAALYNNKLTTIDNYLADNNEINGSHRDLSSRFSEVIDLFLDIKPTKDSVFRFIVQITLLDNTSISDTTNVIKLE